MRKSITINKRRFRVRSYVLDGTTTITPRGGEIWIAPSLRRGLLRTETILHEGLHAAFPRLNERVVTRVAKDLARLLKLLGEIAT